MQSKYSALETRSKELISQQGGAVSGASMALAGLGSRLDQLVEQLIASYSISEQELEVSGMRDDAIGSLLIIFMSFGPNLYVNPYS